MNTAIDFQPTLVGPRVLVRPLVAMDWDALFAAASDPAIWALHPASDRYKEPQFRAFFDAALASGSAFTLVHQASGKVMGSSRYHGYDADAGEIEIGWSFLSCEYWGGSYNLEVKRLLLAHAFTFVEKVVFWVGDTNYRSQRAMEKIGGVRRDGIQTRTMGGVETRNVVFEISREAFQNQNLQPASK